MKRALPVSHTSPAPALKRCRVCDAHTDGKPFRLREMQFGTRDEFDYFQCLACGCIQIAAVPADMGRYYPSTYFSFNAPTLVPGRIHAARDRAKAVRLDLFLWLRRHWRDLPIPKPPDIRDDVLRRLIGRKYPRARDKILDVGSGRGQRLMLWRYAGFTDLTGLDPYLPAPMTYENGVRLLREWRDLREGEFDFIMLNHSLEHMPDQFEAMLEVNRCLKRNRHALLRVPCCSSDAWERYGVNWYQLDAPRHFFIHSLASLRILVQRAGFEIIASEWDSSAWQFWASEQYRRDIPLVDERSYAMAPERSMFTPAEIAQWQSEVETLNAEGRGDQVVLHLRKLRDVRHS